MTHVITQHTSIKNHSRLPGEGFRAGRGTMPKGFQVQAQMTRCAALADGGVTVGFHTKELNTTEKAEVMDFHNQAGWLLFKPSEIPEEDIPKVEAEYEVKTPSQRLRGVMFVWWKQQGGLGEFEEFYRAQMERYIEHIKNKLN